MTTIYCTKCELVYENNKRSTAHPDHPHLVGSRGWFLERVVAFVTRNW